MYRNCLTIIGHFKPIYFYSMKQVYSSVFAQTGPHISGNCVLLIAPIEWLQTQITTNFVTGKVESYLILKDGKSFLELSLLHDTLILDEVPKKSKAGDYWDISIKGAINNHTAQLSQKLQSIGTKQVVAIIGDKKKQYRIFGNNSYGLTVEYSHQNSNGSGGIQSVPIELSGSFELPAPYCIWPLVRLGAPYFKIQSTTSSTITLIWDAVPNASAYTVERSTNANFATSTQVYSGNLLTFIDTGLSSATTYYYRIKSNANSIYAESAYSTNSGTTTAFTLPTLDLWEDWDAYSHVTGTDEVLNWMGLYSGISFTASHGSAPALVNNAINGYPVISSYGINTAKMASALNMPDASTTGATIIIVARQSKTAAVNNDSFGTFIGAGNQRNALITRGANSSIAGTSIEAGIDTLSVINTVEYIPEDTFVTIAIRFDGTTFRLSINNGSETSMVADGPGYIATPVTLFKALGGAQGNKQIARIIWYKRDVGSSTLDQIKDLLRGKYAHY